MRTQPTVFTHRVVWRIIEPVLAEHAPVVGRHFSLDLPLLLRYTSSHSTGETDAGHTNH